MNASLLTVFFGVVGAQLLRYVVLAGGLFVLSQRHTPDALKRRRIAKSPTSKAQASREIRASLGSIVIFGLVALTVVVLRKGGWAPTPAPSTWLNTMLWLPVLLVAQDTYFYFAHRTMHHPRLFKFMHLTHHRSLDPSPLASFSFHPSEALFEALFGLLVSLLVAPPMAAMVLFQFIAFFINLYGHFGIELLPPRFAQHWLFRVLNTTSHHHQHHTSTNFNFGLYFQWWDRLLGTNHPRYEQTFVLNASRGSLHTASDRGSHAHALGAHAQVQAKA